MTYFSKLFSALVIALALFSTSTLMADENKPKVRMQTNLGDIILELDAVKAPASVANFLKYANEGYYNSTVFHRVIDGFMIQGGGFTADLQRKPTNAPVKNEANNQLKNDRGTIAMARTNAPHSATAQFFINVVNNTFLNYRSATPQGWGYTVFGHVIQGMDVVDRIRKVPTGPSGPFGKDVPKTAVIINSVSVITE